MTNTSRDSGPTPSVGHVTGDMKRCESNETRTVVVARKLAEGKLVIPSASCIFVAVMYL